jgi:(1->4)-alpha-D-glucan 1-alpha-D-glucosylmutase
VFAFARGDDLVAIAPRITAHCESWRDTTLALPARPWRDVLTDRTWPGGKRAVSDLLGAFPIALLASNMK